MALATRTKRNPRANIRWPVRVEPAEGAMMGETLNVSPHGVFISCRSPLRLHETFEMTIDVPQLGHPLRASAEVVWSNIYGPDDKITPRGMGVRFTEISDDDRKVISNEVMGQLRREEVEPEADVAETASGPSMN